MATLPVRCAVPLLAATLTLTLPFPLPLAPDVTVSHDAPLVAFHAQPLAAVTLTLPVVAAAATVRLAGLML
jgi:hypothetical protein